MVFLKSCGEIFRNSLPQATPENLYVKKGLSHGSIQTNYSAYAKYHGGFAVYLRLCGVGKPFGIGLVRREPIMVCGVQGILDVGKGGRAKLIVRDGKVE
jgi:hypothetical protein